MLNGPVHDGGVAAAQLELTVQLGMVDVGGVGGGMGGGMGDGMGDGMVRRLRKQVHRCVVHGAWRMVPVASHGGGRFCRCDLRRAKCLPEAVAR